MTSEVLETVLIETNSLVDKYDINFNSKCSPWINADLSKHSTNYVIFEFLSPSNSEGDWYNHFLRRELSYRISFWLNSNQRISSDVVINVESIATNGNLYVLQLPLSYKSNWIYLNVDILYGTYGIPIAHGNMKFQITRYGENSVVEDVNESIKKSKNTVFQRRLSRFLIIKNFKDDDEYCEIDFPTPDKPKARSRKMIDDTLVNLNQLKQRLKSSEWIPTKLHVSTQKRRMSYNPNVNGSNANVNIPSFRASIGTVSSLTNPYHWSMNRIFHIIPTIIPTPTDILISEALIDCQNKAEFISTFHRDAAATAINDHMLDNQKILCTVDDLQLSPDLLEHYKNHRLVVVATAINSTDFDDMNKSTSHTTFLGGIVNTEGRWNAKTNLQCGLIPNETKSFQIKIISLESSINNPSLISSSDHLDGGQYGTTYAHIYDVLEKATISENTVVICQGILSRSSIVLEPNLTFDDDDDDGSNNNNKLDNSRKDSKKRKSKDSMDNDLITTGKYEVVLFMNNSPNHSYVDAVYVVGKITIQIDGFHDTDTIITTTATTTAVTAFVSNESYKYSKESLIHNILSAEPLLPWIEEHSYINSSNNEIKNLSLIYDQIDNFDHILPIFSNIWSRILSSSCKGIPLTEYPSLLEIPFSFLLEEKQIKRSIRSVEFWGHHGEDEPERIYNVLTSILSRLSSRYDYNDTIFIDLLIDRMVKNSSIVVLWMYIQNWILSPAMQTLVSHRDDNLTIYNSNRYIDKLSNRYNISPDNNYSTFIEKEGIDDDEDDDGISSDSKDMTTIDWVHIRCVSWCLLLLRRLEIKQNPIIAETLNSSSKSSYDQFKNRSIQLTVIESDISVGGFAEDILQSLLQYAVKKLDQVCSHINDVLSKHRKELKFESILSSSSSSLAAAFSDSGTQYKSKLRIDHDRNRYEEKITMLQISLEYLYFEVIVPIMEITSILMEVISEISRVIIKSFDKMVSLFLQFNNVMFDEYITLTDIKDLSTSSYSNTSLGNTKPTISANLKLQRETTRKQKLVAREKLITSIRLIISQYHRLLFSNLSYRTYTITDILCLMIPTVNKGDKKSHSSSSLYDNDLNQDLPDSLFHSLSSISSFLKIRYRYYILSTKEYNTEPVICSRILNESDMLFQSIQSIIASISLFTSNTISISLSPHRNTNQEISVERGMFYRIDKYILKYFSQVKNLLDGCVGLVEAMTTISYAITKLSNHSNSSTNSKTNVTSNQNMYYMNHTNSILLDYMRKQSIDGNNSNNSNNNSRSDEDDRSMESKEWNNLDDELMIVFWNPMRHLFRLKSIFISNLFYFNRNMFNVENMTVYNDRIQSLLDGLARNSDDFSDNLISFITFLSQASNLIWQTIDILIASRRLLYPIPYNTILSYTTNSSGNNITSSDTKTIYENSVSYLIYTSKSKAYPILFHRIRQIVEFDISILSAFVSSLSLLPISDNDNFSINEVNRYDRIRKDIITMTTTTMNSNHKIHVNFNHDEDSNHIPMNYYIGLDYHRMLYGEHILTPKSISNDDIITMTMISTSSYDIILDKISNNISYISQWLIARYSLLASMLSIVKATSTIGMIDIQSYIPNDTIQYQNLFNQIDKYNISIPKLVYSIKELSDCSIIGSIRKDIRDLCLKHTSDTEIIIRMLYDIACYLPSYDSSEHYKQVMASKPLFEQYRTKKLFHSSDTVNVNSNTMDISSNSNSNNVINIQSTKISTPTVSNNNFMENVINPTKLSRKRSKLDLLNAVNSYYCIISDCRYIFLFSLIQLLQSLSRSNHVLKHEDIFIKLTYRAILCSLPSESIVLGCPTLNALYGYQYRFKNLILSLFSRNIYQKGCGQVLQSIYTILKLPSSIQSIALMSIREKLLNNLSSIRLYVFGKAMSAYRYVLAEKGIHDMSYTVAPPTINDLLGEKISNLYASRYDTLIIISALHSFLRTALFSFQQQQNTNYNYDNNSNSSMPKPIINYNKANNETNRKEYNLEYVDMLRTLLRELEFYSIPRVSNTGNGNIQLYLFKDQLQSNNSNASYLDIHYPKEVYALDNVDSYSKAIGIMTDPIEELGKSFLAYQSLLELHLLEHTKAILLSNNYMNSFYQNESKDRYNIMNNINTIDSTSNINYTNSLNPFIESEDDKTNNVSESLSDIYYNASNAMNNMNISVNTFSVEEQEYIHSLEREHKLIRRIFHRMEEMGDWESAYMFIEKVIVKYTKQKKEVNDLVDKISRSVSNNSTMSNTISDSMNTFGIASLDRVASPITNITSNYSTPSRLTSKTMDRSTDLVRSTSNSSNGSNKSIDKEMMSHDRLLKGIDRSKKLSSSLASPLVRSITSPVTSPKLLDRTISPTKSIQNGSNISPNISPSTRGISKTSYNNYLLYRWKTLIKELNTNLDRVRQRITNDAKIRIYPTYYVIRYDSDIPLSHGVKSIPGGLQVGSTVTPTIGSFRNNDSIIKKLGLEDFLEATNLTFLGVNMMGSYSSYGQSGRESNSIKDPSSVLPSDIDYRRTVRFADENSGTGDVYDYSMDSIYGQEANNNLGKDNQGKSNNSNSSNLNNSSSDNNNSSVNDKNLSLDGLGQGLWIILRYDPTAYIASAKLYQQYIESHIKSKKSVTESMDIPVPPISYSAVLTKLHEAYPNYRILSSHRHIEQNDSETFAQSYSVPNTMPNIMLNNLLDDRSIANRDEVKIPTIQLFEAYPTCLMNESDTLESIQLYLKKRNEENNIYDEYDNENEYNDSYESNNAENNNRNGNIVSNSQNIVYTSEEYKGENNRNDNQISQTLQSDGVMKSIDAMEVNKWQETYQAQEFYIFAYEDESKQHHRRFQLDNDDIYAPINPTNDDLSDTSCPRLIRYTIALNWNPITSSKDYSSNIMPFDSSLDNYSYNNDSNLAEAMLFDKNRNRGRYSSNSSNDNKNQNGHHQEMFWLASSGIAYVKYCKRISVIHGIAQLLQYYSQVVSTLSLAIEHILSLTAKEYDRQLSDDIIHSDTILTGAISILTNIFVQPGITCLGLHNAEVLIAGEIDHRDIVWQQKRKEIRRSYFRSLSEHEAYLKTLPKAQRAEISPPQEPDYNQLEENYYQSYEHLEGVIMMKDDILNKCNDIFKGLRKFVHLLGTTFKKKKSITTTADDTEKTISPLDKLKVSKDQQKDIDPENLVDLPESKESSKQEPVDETQEIVKIWKCLLLWLEANAAASSGGYAL